MSPKLKPYLSQRIKHSHQDVIPAGQGAVMELQHHAWGGGLIADINRKPRQRYAVHCFTKITLGCAVIPPLASSLLQIMCLYLQLTSLSLLKSSPSYRRGAKKKKKKLGVQLYLYRTMRPVESGFLQALLGSSFHVVAHSATRLTTDTPQPWGMRAARTLLLKVTHTVLNKRAGGHKLQ